MVFGVSSALAAPSAGVGVEPTPAPTMTPAPTGYQTYTAEMERDLPLRQKTPLYLEHELGNVTIQGWVQDRIRVKLIKKVVAPDQAQADAELKKFDLITLETPKSFEMRVGHTRGTDLVTKMRDEKSNPVTVDLEIKAPYQMDLTILLGEHRQLSIDQWKGAIHLTGKNSVLTLNRLNLQKPMHVNCRNCSVQADDSKVSGYLLLGDREANLRNVESTGRFFIDSGSGEVRLDRTSGRMSVHTRSGRLNSSNHHGRLAFQSNDGGLSVTGLKGDLEAQTESGPFMIDVDQLNDFLRLDTEKSDIQVNLPTSFEGALDLLSLSGEVMVQFPLEKSERAGNGFYGPASPGQVDARIGNASKITIHAYSKQGGVRILRKVPHT